MVLPSHAGTQRDPCPGPPSHTRGPASGRISPGSPDTRLLLGNLTLFCALIMACHLEQIPHVTGEIINMLAENFLFFLIKAHNSF